MAGPLEGLIDAGDVIDTHLMGIINDELQSLSGAAAGLAGTDVPNGNFEIDSDTDGVPDAWANDGTTSGKYGGHSIEWGGTDSVILETTSPLDGSASIKMIHPGGGGNGGGLLESDFITCSPAAPFRLSWVHKSTAAAILNIVRVYWYTAAQVDISSDDVYSSTTNPTVATQFSAACTPPATARYYTIGLIGGDTTVDTPGGAGFPETAYFDSVTVQRISTRVATVTSSVSSIEFTNIVDSRRFKLHLLNLVTSSFSDISCQISSDNGATWISSAIYADKRQHDNIGANPNETSLVVAESYGVYPLTYIIDFCNLGETAYKFITSDGFCGVTATTYNFRNKVHLVESATACNAIKIFPSSGTINSGLIILEELY